jgi:hypothetical protein
MHPLPTALCPTQTIVKDEKNGCIIMFIVELEFGEAPVIRTLMNRKEKKKFQSSYQSVATAIIIAQV